MLNCVFRKIILFFFLAGIVFSAQAQKVRLTGSVKDSVSGEPLPLITVLLEGTTFGANTNLEGEFQISAPPGKYLLKVQYSGYTTFRDSIDLASDLLDYHITLAPVSSSLNTVEITSRDINPSHRIIRNAIHNKKKNRFDKIDSYEYEAYNKLVISMDKVDDKLLSNKLIKNVGDEVKAILGDSNHTDTTKYKIAVFVSESVSRFYYDKPDKRKEEIIAVRTSGVKGSEYNLLNSMFLQLDLYENNVVIVDRTFLSPIADGAFVDYDFELISAEPDGRDTLFGIRVLPKRPFDPVFKGVIYIENTDWAITRLDLTLNSDPNINFVENITVRQEFSKVDTQWVPTMLDIEVDFQNGIWKRKDGKAAGLIGRKSSNMYNYILNEPKEPKFYAGEIIEIKEDAEEKDSTYWVDHRRSPLDRSEELGYALVDSITTKGLLDFYIEQIEILTFGKKKFKYFEVGPYFYLFGYNQAEGFRTRIGVYTRDAFSKRLYLGGHLAYGFGDRQFKYQGEVKYLINRSPKIEIGAQKTYEIEQVGFQDFLNSGTSLLQTMLRRVPFTQLNYYHEHRLDLYSDVLKGLSANLYYRNKVFLPASTFSFAYRAGDGSTHQNFTISEVGMDLRISFKEEFITSAKGDRVYIGTKFPVFHIKAVQGFAGFLDGDFDYRKLEVGARNFVRLGRYGWFRYDIKAGQVFGTLPYPALHVFRGNMTWGYDKYGFNLMNYFEFVADRYLTGAFEQHFEGLLINKIPLIRRLKWKEALTARVAWGTLNDNNIMMNSLVFPGIDGNPYSQSIKAPQKEPYLEAGAGIYNIFKFIRIDGVWRLNYHDLSYKTNPDIPKANWGRFNNFGLRVNLQVTF